MAYRRYSDQDKAVALAALETHHGNVTEAAAFAGVPRKTLEEWRDGRTAEDVANIRQEVKQSLADRLEDIAHQYLDVLPEKIPKATLMQLSTALAIAVDKMQLLRGEATSISGTASREERVEELRTLIRRHSISA